MKNYLPSFTILSLALMALMTYSFTTAQWVNPTVAPTGGNAAAPINVGGSYQHKQGDLGAVRMRAGQYCDQNGNNCITSSSLGGGGSSAFFGARGGQSPNGWQRWEDITGYDPGTVSTIGSSFNPSNGRFTVNEAGFYYVYMSGASVDGCSNDRQGRIRIMVNGTGWVAEAQSSGSPQGSQTEGNALSTSALVWLNAGDNVAFQGWEDCHGSSNFFRFVNSGGFKIN